MYLKMDKNVDKTTRGLNHLAELEEKYGVQMIHLNSAEDITTNDCIDYISKLIPQCAENVQRRDLFRPGYRPAIR